MSKSDPSDLSRINLTDTKDEIVNKIKKAKTDNFSIPDNINNLEKRPEAKNLLSIFSSLKNQSLNDTISQFSGKNFSNFKNSLTDILIEIISPIGIEIRKLKKDSTFIDKVLLEGTQKADLISSQKVKEMKKIIGF